MFVITADQRGSRRSPDLVPAAIAMISALPDTTIALTAERTAGDEIQVATADGATAVAIALTLARADAWSIGIGVGAVETPLPTSVRAARGTAFVRARDAVDRAKRAPGRLALTGAPDSVDAADAESFARVLVELRDRRSTAGWEVHDLLSSGLTQREAAHRLGVTESAVSLRVRIAGLRTEESARPALVRAFERAEQSSGA